MAWATSSLPVPEGPVINVVSWCMDWKLPRRYRSKLLVNTDSHTEARRRAMDGGLPTMFGKILTNARSTCHSPANRCATPQVDAAATSSKPLPV